MNTWFSSDWHIGHKNIIKYQNRPFNDTKGMNQFIIDNMNKYIKKKDHLYILGDIGLCSPKTLDYYLSQLVCGNLFWIIGNHDRALPRKKSLKKYFKLIDKYATIKVNGEFIFLCHYPCQSWDRSGVKATFSKIRRLQHRLWLRPMISTF